MGGFVLTATQRKGGVGRSTLLYCLAGSFAKRGLKTLIVDLDPQASISQICLSPEAVDVLPPGRTVAALFGDNFFGSVRELIQPAGFPGADLVPGSNSLARYNYPEPEKAGDVQDVLREALADVRSEYDAILCDTPPSLETLSWVPAVAADLALTPSPAAALAVQELVHAGRFLERVRWSRNPRLVWGGVILTMVQKIAIHQALAESLREAYGDLVLTNQIPFHVAFQEVAIARQPLAYWKPKGGPAKAVDAVAGEILDRLAKVRGIRESQGEAA
jgi:chromosome partitioning protein